PGQLRDGHPAHDAGPPGPGDRRRPHPGRRARDLPGLGPARGPVFFDRGVLTMRRVVVTGMGVVSCLGNDLDTVSELLRAGRAGIRFVPEYEELGLRSQVAGVPEIDLVTAIDRKLKRFMGDAAGYAYVA